MRTLIDRVVEWVLAACLGVMTCLVFFNVFSRFVLNFALVWSDELASMLFAWLTFVGAYVGSRSRSHIAIDTLVIFLPPRLQRGLARLVEVGVLLLLGLFAWQGARLTITTWGLEFASMEISRGYLYLSFPVGAVLMGVGVIQRWRKPDPPTPGQEEQP